MQLISTLKDDLGHTFFSMYYNSEGNYLLVKWEGQTVAKDIYAGSEEQMKWAVSDAADLKCKAVMNDCRLLQGSLVETTEWANEVWSPAMYRSGIHYNAIIQSDDIFSQLSLEAFEELTAGAGHITNKIFNNPDSGREWINAKYNSVV